MAVVDVAVAVGAAVVGEGAAAGIVGGAILGAGVGAGYSLLTGDGNVLNSALTGAALGGAGMGLAGAAEAAAAPAVTGTEAAASASPALQAAQGLTSADVAGLNQAALSQGVFAEGSAALPGSNLAVAPATIPPPTASTLLNTQMSDVAKTGLGLKGTDLVKYGLAGTAALSLLGSQNQKGLPSTNTGTSSPAMIRPYTYSQTKNPNYGQPGEPYYIQSYTAQTPYKAASGGIMHYAIGGGVGNMYPQSQQEHINFATPTQMPTSAEVVNADYDQVTNPYTGNIPRFADGGMPDPVVPAQLIQPTTTYTPAPQAPTQLQQQIADYNKGIAAAANQEYNIAPPPLAGLPGGGQNASKEDLNKIINQYYVQNLSRPAEQEGLDFWTGQVTNKGMTLGDVVKGIQGSQEYQTLHPAPVAPVTTSPTVTQEDIDAYLAANPTMAKVYNPVTQTYTTPTPSAADVAAWKAKQVSTEMFTAPDGSLWSSKEAYDRAHPVGEAAGGLLAGYAAGGLPQYNLGSYSDGGRLLKGPGDGMSDNIPASIADKQPARLADGEFVVPADVVSHLGNGSTDAGAKRLYAMMDNVRKARTGSKKQGKQIKADKYLPT